MEFLPFDYKNEEEEEEAAALSETNCRRRLNQPAEKFVDFRQHVKVVNSIFI